MCYFQNWQKDIQIIKFSFVLFFKGFGAGGVASLSDEARSEWWPLSPCGWPWPPTNPTPKCNLKNYFNIQHLIFLKSKLERWKTYVHKCHLSSLVWNPDSGSPLDLLTSSFAPFVRSTCVSQAPHSSGNPKIFRKHQSWVVRNTVKGFGVIHIWEEKWSGVSWRGMQLFVVVFQEKILGMNIIWMQKLAFAPNLLALGVKYNLSAR